MEEKAVVYQSAFSHETQLGKVQMKRPTYGLCFIHWATTRMRYKHGLKTNHRFGIHDMEGNNFARPNTVGTGEVGIGLTLFQGDISFLIPAKPNSMV